MTAPTTVEPAVEPALPEAAAHGAGGYGVIHTPRAPVHPHLHDDVRPDAARPLAAAGQDPGRADSRARRPGGAERRRHPGSGPRRQRGAARAEGCRAQLPRHLSAPRHVPFAGASLGRRLRSCGRRGGGRRCGEDAQGGRSRRLCERAARRLCGAPHHRRGRAGQVARQHRLRAGRRRHAQGHDRAISGSQGSCARARRQRARPCGGGRHRPSSLPMARPSGRHRHRLRRQRRQAQPRRGAWLPPRHRLSAGGHRRMRGRSQRRRGPPAGLRFRRPRHRRGLRRLPSPRRHARPLRQFVGRRSAPRPSPRRRRNPSRSCAPACSRRTPRRRHSRRAQAPSSRRSKAAPFPSASTGAMRSPMRRRRTATSKRAGPPARAC